MKLNINIKRPGFRQVKESYFFPFMVLVVGLGFIMFSQSNFDEDKVNEAIYITYDSTALFAKKMNILGESDSNDFILEAKSQNMTSQQRPKRRPFSAY